MDFNFAQFLNQMIFHAVSKSNLCTTISMETLSRDIGSSHCQPVPWTQKSSPHIHQSSPSSPGSNPHSTHFGVSFQGKSPEPMKIEVRSRSSSSFCLSHSSTSDTKQGRTTPKSTYGIPLVHIQRKLGPNAQMNNTPLDPVRPVVIDDFDILYHRPHNHLIRTKKKKDPTRDQP